MNFKQPKNTEKYYWTQHSIMKMRQYGLSAQRIIRAIRNPQRKENGIVKNTIAVMQPSSVRRDKSGKKIWNSEIWTMYQLKKRNVKLKTENLIQNYANQQIRIISAWRYPGISPRRDPIPKEILEEILDNIES